MDNALIGYTGFLGSNLKKQNDFNFFYNSKNINEIKNKSFDLIVCCAPNAEKWLANKEPLKDLNNIKNLIENLNNVICKKFILLSTVDVFYNPIDVNENTLIDEKKLNPYGFNRRLFEKFVQNNFNNHLIIRLPALIGNGLKKNAIFDLHNNNQISKINNKSIFQFYPVHILWKNIEIANKSKLKIIHFNSEPITISEIASKCFNMTLKHEVNTIFQNYDMKSLHVNIFNKYDNFYQLSKDEIISSINYYIQNEPLKIF